MDRVARFLSAVPLLRRWVAPSRLPMTDRPAPAARADLETTLRADGVSRGFGDGSTRMLAVNGVSLELRRGELNLLMGPSGSGKSTLLAVLSALLRPDAGSVRALGHDIWRMTPRELERFRLRHCSYIFQGYNLFPALTAREQLEVVLRWGEGVSGSAARKRADRVLGRLGLGNKTHLRPAQLSGGEKQRVAIARALVKNPSFVFADEPTSALDWENGQQVIGLLTDTAREHGATVLVVTHDHRLVPFADRVFEMADGRLREADPNGTKASDTGRFHLDRTVLEGELPPIDSPRLRLREPMVVTAGH